MRKYAYIWECVHCAVGTYKETDTILRKDCLECRVGKCPLYDSLCDGEDMVMTKSSSPLYIESFKTPVVLSSET